MQIKKISLVILISVVGVNLYLPLAANACGRFDFACKARQQAKRVKEAAYRTHPTYIQALTVTKVAKRRGVIRGRDCRDIVETGSWVGAASAAASGVGTSISALVRVVGKDAGNLMCSDAGM